MNPDVLLGMAMIEPGKLVPIKIFRHPRRFWRRYKTRALQHARALGMTRNEWERVRIESSSPRDADMWLVVMGRVPEPGAFNHIREILAIRRRRVA